MIRIMCFRRIFNAMVIALLIPCGMAIPVRGSADDIGGVVSGYVRDEYDRPLNAATVTLRSSDTPVSFRTTDRKGYFTFLAVLPGTYFVIADQRDYVTCSTYFVIYPSQIKSLHFRLPAIVKTVSYITTRFFDHCRTLEPIRAISF